eukprot:335836-Rhodomonas_salina.1
MDMEREEENTKAEAAYKALVPARPRTDPPDQTTFKIMKRKSFNVWVGFHGEMSVQGSEGRHAETSQTTLPSSLSV